MVQYVWEGIEDLDVVWDVVNCVEILNNDDDCFCYFVRRFLVVVVIQIYYYMFQVGFEMGFVVIGEVMIFFKIDWVDLFMLYYYVV